MPLSTMVRDYSYDQKETIKSFFTDSEWLAIEEAMGDYQDYGDRASELSDSIGSKIYQLFKNDPKHDLKITDL